MKETSSAGIPSIRRYDLDWLRTLAVLLVVPFHSLLVFVQKPDSVVFMKDTIDCIACDRVAGFIDQFHMPLLFLIAGMSSAFSLAKRSGGKYLLERIERLLVPLLFGVAVVIPPMTYITQIAAGKTLTFWQHYASFFTFGPDLTGRSGTFTPAHLWFILYLFAFSLIGLPLFLLLRRKNSQGFIQGMAKFFEKPMAFLIMGLLIAIGGRIELMGAVNPIYFLFVFLCGYVLATSERYQKAIARDWPWMLALGVILEVMRRTGLPYTIDNTLPRALRDVAMEFNRWVWVLGILGVGHLLLNRGGKVLTYLSEAAYPFYILHFVVLTSVTYFIVKIQSAVIVKYTLIVLITFAITFLLYEVARRITPLRFLLGMKIHQPKPQIVTKEAVTHA